MTTPPSTPIPPSSQISPSSPISKDARSRLHAELDRAVRRRRATRGAMVAAAMVPLVTVIGALLWANRSVPITPPLDQGPSMAANEDDAGTIDLAPTEPVFDAPLIRRHSLASTRQVTVHTRRIDGLTINRITNAPARLVHRLTDAELLERLAMADAPSGLAEYRGRVVIIPLEPDAVAMRR